MQRSLMNTTYLQSKIGELHALHNRTIEDYGELVVNLNKECDILCEIIPSYKISSELEGQDGVRKKKEVYNVERLENEMLKQYEHFLQLLRKLQRKKHPEQQALGSRLCAKLLGTATEFNHADVLLRLAVDYANCKSTRVAQPCLKALSEHLDGRMIGDSTDAVVSAILDIVRNQEYAINPKILNSLLHVRVAMVDMHRRDLTEEKAKNKRMKKEDKELARQMQKSKARTDRSEIAAKQTRILHKLFVIYLRVIKASQTCARTHQTKILAPALEGLVKFAPLVNLELHQQLMTALRELLDDEHPSVTTKLHALVAVASLAQKDATLEAAEWRSDLSYFHEILFRCIPEALEAPKNEDEKKPAAPEEEGDVDDAASVGSTSSAGSLSSVAFSIAASMAQANFVQANASREWGYRVGLVLRTVDLLVLSQKHLPVIRVSAFVRRLLQCTVMCPPHIAMSLMALCHRLALRYPATSAILVGGADNVIGGRGSYNPEAHDTGSAHAECSFFWEASFHRKSFHPTLRNVANSLSTHYHKISKHQHGQPVVVSKQLDALGPYEVLDNYNPSMGDIKPDPPTPSALKQARNRPQKRNREESDVSGAAAADAEHSDDE
eukprot:CAMPEP_0176430786 /NCGR_PEP_ID=MMETSP0127-20121128/14446_1 /TAXON_ID=938130 /ORGANISM="Platyophrya macrostoma, Strain WH" /LENGTH=609 /DNA_ID=CAMNT_0017812713 /DNA_START=91 /DNA_END=1920 /DNA_ORIENTATION=-